MDPRRLIYCFLSLRIPQIFVLGAMIGLGLHLRDEFWFQSATVPSNVWFTIIFSSLTLIYSVLVTPFICLLTLPHLHVYTILDILLATGLLLVAIQMVSKFSIRFCEQDINQGFAVRHCTWYDGPAKINEIPAKIVFVLSILCWYVQDCYVSTPSHLTGNAVFYT